MTASAGSSTAVIEVTGMHCASCAALIEETLGEQAGVANVKVDLEGARATVDFDPATVALAELCDTIGELGYGATPEHNTTPEHSATSPASAHGASPAGS